MPKRSKKDQRPKPPKLEIEDTHQRVTKITNRGEITTFTRRRGENTVAVTIRDLDAFYPCQTAHDAHDVPSDMLRQAVDALLREDF